MAVQLSGNARREDSNLGSGVKSLRRTSSDRAIGSNRSSSTPPRGAASADDVTDRSADIEKMAMATFDVARGRRTAGGTRRNRSRSSELDSPTKSTPAKRENAREQSKSLRRTSSTGSLKESTLTPDAPPKKSLAMKRSEANLDIFRAKREEDRLSATLASSAQQPSRSTEDTDDTSSQSDVTSEQSQSASMTDNSSSQPNTPRDRAKHERWSMEDESTPTGAQQFLAGLETRRVLHRAGSTEDMNVSMHSTPGKVDPLATPAKKRLQRLRATKSDQNVLREVDHEGLLDDESHSGIFQQSRSQLGNPESEKRLEKHGSDSSVVMRAKLEKLKKLEQLRELKRRKEQRKQLRNAMSVPHGLSAATTSVDADFERSSSPAHGILGVDPHAIRKPQGSSGGNAPPSRVLMAESHSDRSGDDDTSANGSTGNVKPVASGSSNARRVIKVASDNSLFSREESLSRHPSTDDDNEDGNTSDGSGGIAVVKTVEDDVDGDDSDSSDAEDYATDPLPRTNSAKNKEEMLKRRSSFLRRRQEMIARSAAGLTPVGPEDDSPYSSADEEEIPRTSSFELARPDPVSVPNKASATPRTTAVVYDSDEEGGRYYQSESGGGGCCGCFGGGDNRREAHHVAR